MLVCRMPILSQSFRLSVYHSPQIHALRATLAQQQLVVDLIRELRRSQLPLCLGLGFLFRRWYFDGCDWTLPLAFFRFLALVLARSGLATVS